VHGAKRRLSRGTFTRTTGAASNATRKIEIDFSRTVGTEKGTRNMVIASNAQLECRHIIGVTTKGHVAHLVYQDEDLDIWGGIAFTYCPMCGAVIDHKDDKDGRR
jgi:hypothetical protein